MGVGARCVSVTTTVCSLARELGASPDFLYDLGLPDDFHESAAVGDDDDVLGPVDAHYHDGLSPEEVHHYRQAWAEWVRESAVTGVRRWIAFFEKTEGRSTANDMVLTDAARYGADVALSMQALADLDRGVAAEVLDSQGAEHAERLREIVSDDLSEAGPNATEKGMSQ